MEDNKENEGNEGDEGDHRATKDEEGATEDRKRHQGDGEICGQGHADLIIHFFDRSSETEGKGVSKVAF